MVHKGISGTDIAPYTPRVLDKEAEGYDIQLIENIVQMVAKLFLSQIGHIKFRYGEIPSNSTMSL